MMTILIGVFPTLASAFDMARDSISRGIWSREGDRSLLAASPAPRQASTSAGTCAKADDEMARAVTSTAAGSLMTWPLGVGGPMEKSLQAQRFRPYRKRSVVSRRLTPMRPISGLDLI